MIHPSSQGRGFSSFGRLKEQKRLCIKQKLYQSPASGGGTWPTFVAQLISGK
jgi:hypothetical protein